MFLGAGVAIWAGIQLSEQTDVLTMRLGFGSALGGLILWHGLSLWLLSDATDAARCQTMITTKRSDIRHSS